jgi:exodeoxyribonuclease-5
VKTYGDIADRTLRMAKVKSDPYFNALQIKFAYCLTCHKTQGGQWHTVFLDQSFLKPDQFDKEYIRWLYTAVTRAKQRIFLINYPEEYFV